MTCNKVIVISFLFLILIDTLIAYVIANTFITINDIENTCGTKCEHLNCTSNEAENICHNRNKHCVYSEKGNKDISCNDGFICSSDLKNTLKFCISIIMPIIFSAWISSVIMIFINVSPLCKSNKIKISVMSEILRIILLISFLILVICSNVYISEDTSELYFLLSLISIILCFLSYFTVCTISYYQIEVVSEEKISLV